MKLYLSLILIISCLMLIIPSFALINKDKSSVDNVKIQENSDVSSNKNKSKITSKSKIKVLNHKTEKVFDIKLVDYVIGVVMSEIPASFHEEAIKAQAVAINTYLIKQIDSQQQEKNPDLKGAHISTDPNSFQGYMSDSQAKSFYKDKYNEYKEKISKCVFEVIDKVITYDDKPIVAAYHSISNGKTETAEVVWGNDLPYLQPVESTLDTQNENYENKLSIPAYHVEEVLKDANKDIFFPQDKSLLFNIQKISTSNSVLEVLVGNVSFSGNQIRNLFDLKSSTFEVTYEDENFIFTTKGFGHGVGMSQYGANSLADQGNSYEKILKHYYKDVEIVNISN